MVGNNSSSGHLFPRRCRLFSFFTLFPLPLPFRGERKKEVVWKGSVSGQETTFSTELRIQHKGGEKWLQSGKRRGASIGKQGLLKTLEALIALFLSFTLLIVFIPRDTTTQQATEPKGFLPILRENDAFRSCVVSKNVTCINQTINDNLEDNFNFAFNLSNSASADVGGLPNVQIFSESLFITGNATNSTNTILRVFYWNR